MSSDPKPPWDAIVAHFPGRELPYLIDHWDHVVNPSLVKTSWTPLEDDVIANWVATHGPTHWAKLAETLPGRKGKQCHDRWQNRLDPSLVQTTWLPYEDHLIFQMQKEVGNKWARIADLLPGRTGNAVKNRWKSVLRSRASKKEIATKKSLRPRPLNPAPIAVDSPTPENPYFGLDWKETHTELFEAPAKMDGGDSALPAECQFLEFD
jgi:hypothetical protein